MPPKDKEIGQKLYESGQIYINFLLDSNHISTEFKDKIKSKEALKYYLIDKNREKFNTVNKKPFHDLHYLLKPIYFKQLNLEVGHCKT